MIRVPKEFIWIIYPYYSVVYSFWLCQTCNCPISSEIALKDEGKWIFIKPKQSRTTLQTCTETLRSGPWFNIKISSYQYRKSHCGDKTVVRSSSLLNGISYTGKMSSLYWIGALIYVQAILASISIVYKAFICHPRGQIRLWPLLYHIFIDPYENEWWKGPGNKNNFLFIAFIYPYIILTAYVPLMYNK